MPDGAPVAPGAGLGVATDEVTFNLTGTVSKNGTTTVTGTTTAFLSELSVGQVIRIPGTATEDRIVAAIASDTSLTVTVAFTNTASGQTGQRVQHAQLFKLAYSADGVATLASVDVNGQLVNTELPAAAALSDTIGNPTTPMVGSPKMIWDGSQWTRAKQTLNDGTALGTVGVSTTAIALADMVNNSVAMSGSGGDAKTGAYVAAFGVHAYNGATMDRMRGDTTNGLDVDVTRFPRPATPTLANVAGSASSVTLQASNTARMGWMCWNDSTSIMYLKFGSTASATSATVKLGPDDYYELPQPVYTGIITGIWVSAVGSARVTEITA